MLSVKDIRSHGHSTIDRDEWTDHPIMYNEKDNMKVRRRVIVNTQAPELASYVKGPILTNGALEFIYRKPVAWPLFKLTGPGIQTLQQFNVVQSPQLFGVLALTVAPVYGPGTPAGSITFQGLVDESGVTFDE
jgi:hypothetical protein